MRRDVCFTNHKAFWFWETSSKEGIVKIISRIIICLEWHLLFASLIIRFEGLTHLRPCHHPRDTERQHRPFCHNISTAHTIFSCCHTCCCIYFELYFNCSCWRQNCIFNTWLLKFGMLFVSNIYLCFSGHKIWPVTHSVWGAWKRQKWHHQTISRSCDITGDL